MDQQNKKHIKSFCATDEVINKIELLAKVMNRSRSQIISEAVMKFGLKQTDSEKKYDMILQDIDSLKTEWNKVKKIVMDQ